MTEETVKRTSRKYCRWCGFAIVYENIRTGKQFFGPFWRKAWVHENGGHVHCMWTAAPKRKGDRTLYQQIADARALSIHTRQEES